MCENVAPYTIKKTGATAVLASATNTEHRHMDIRVDAGCEIGGRRVHNYFVKTGYPQYNFACY